MRDHKMIERLALWFGRRFQFRGSGRLLIKVYPADQRATRYLAGLYPRADGLTMALDSRNWIDWNILFRGAFEPDLDRMIEAVLPVGGVALDVGANIGAHTLTMARVVGSGGRVLAFEPNPQVLESLERNVQANGQKAIVHAYGCALGDKEAEMQLRVPAADSKEGSQMGLASLVALNTPHKLVSVAVRTVDGVVADAGLDQVDFVKIDVQGFECQVLRGMRAVLRRFRPVLVFEYERWAWGQGQGSLAQALEELENAGYGVWYQEDTVVKTIDADTIEEALPAHVDLVALPHGDRRMHVLGLGH